MFSFSSIFPIGTDDQLPMVLEECKPLLARVAPATHSRQIPGYAPLRDDEAKLLQLAGSWALPNRDSLPPGAEPVRGSRR